MRTWRILLFVFLSLVFSPDDRFHLSRQSGSSPPPVDAATTITYYIAERGDAVKGEKKERRGRGVIYFTKFRAWGRGFKAHDARAGLAMRACLRVIFRKRDRERERDKGVGTGAERCAARGTKGGSVRFVLVIDRWKLSARGMCLHACYVDDGSV